MEKVIVKFVGSWRGYSAGEIAGFAQDVAQSLIDGGRAELFDQKKGKAALAKGKAPSKAAQSGPAESTGGATAEGESSDNLDGSDTTDGDEPKP